MRTALFLALLAACAAQAAPARTLVETEFSPPRAYVGAEVVLRLRLLREPGLPYGVLRPPRLGDEAEVSPLGLIRDYETTRAGRTYQVRERAYLVVPRRAGSIALPAPQVEGPLRHAPEYGRGPRGKPPVLEVLAPRAAPGELWLPARRLWLEESWSHDPATLAAGVPVVRTLSVRAEGITGNRLPRLEMAPQPGLSVHQEAGRFASGYLEWGMGGRREQRVVLLPVDEGVIELPALSVGWWDVVADEARVATLPARTLRVGAAAALEAQAPAAEAEPMDVLRAFAAGLFVLCLAALSLYVWRQPERDARRRLRLACRRNEAVAAREALVDWWKSATKTERTPVLARMGERWDAQARAQLAALDAALYGGKPWDGKAFWRAVRPALRAGRKRQETAAPPLPFLFRLQARR